MPDKQKLNGGQLLVRCLENQGVERVFLIPGESYLAVLDGLHDSTIEAVVARQEGGAAIMAEADGKLSGRPGICMVTRGPGAANAAAGVHIAQQDSTPLILLIGQVSRGDRHRDAFQEVDYHAFYGGMAKHVEEVQDPDRLPEAISRAFHIALGGRPGPVVMALPEDMLLETATADACGRAEVALIRPTEHQIEAFSELLLQAEKPFVVIGGPRAANWSEEGIDRLAEFAARWQLPVSCSFRRQGLFDHLHPCYAGDLGLQPRQALLRRIEEADLLILLGTRFSEMASQGYTLIDIPRPKTPLVHVLASSDEIGRLYNPTLGVAAAAGEFAAAALNFMPAPESPPPWAEGTARLHQDYLDWSEQAQPPAEGISLGSIICWLRDQLPADAITTVGAGNYSSWLQRFQRPRRAATFLGSTSGSMGYGLPAAIAAQLRHRDRFTLCFAGDGCIQMTMQEFGTAVQVGVTPLVIVVDNSMYGTIRTHQERVFPGRVSATALRNPDFAAIARAYGGHGETVSSEEEFPEAFRRARASGKAALIHLAPVSNDLPSRDGPSSGAAVR